MVSLCALDKRASISTTNLWMSEHRGIPARRVDGQRGPQFRSFSRCWGCLSCHPPLRLLPPLRCRTRWWGPWRPPATPPRAALAAVQEHTWAANAGEHTGQSGGKQRPSGGGGRDGWRTRVVPLSGPPARYEKRYSMLMPAMRRGVRPSSGNDGPARHSHAHGLSANESRRGKGERRRQQGGRDGDRSTSSRRMGRQGAVGGWLTVARHNLVLLHAVNVVRGEHGRAGHRRGQPRQQPLARAGQQLRTAPGTARGGEGPQRRSTGAGSRREAGAQARERPGWRGAGPGRPRAREERAHSEGGPLQCASCWPLPDRK